MYEEEKKVIELTENAEGAHGEGETVAGGVVVDHRAVRVHLAGAWLGGGRNNQNIISNLKIITMIIVIILAHAWLGSNINMKFICTIYIIIMALAWPKGAKIN